MVAFLTALFLFLAVPARAQDAGSFCRDGHASLRPAASYCAVFEKTAPLRGDGLVRQGKDFCVRYHEQAIATVNLFCGYVADSAKVQADGTTMSAGTQAQAGRGGALRRAGALTGEARKAYEAYLVKVERQYDQLGVVEAAYRKALKHLAEAGEQRLVKELHCEQRGEPGGAAEGAQVIGAAKYAVAAELQLTGFLNDMLKIFHRTLHNDWTAAKALEQKLEARDQHGGSTGTAPELAAVSEEHHGINIGKTVSGSYDDIAVAISGPLARTASTGVAQSGATAAEVTRAERRMLAKAMNGAKVLIQPELLGPAVTTVFYLGLSEKVDGLTLSNLGLLVLGSVAGAPATAMLALGAGLDMFESEIRARWQRIDLAVAEPLLAYVKQHPEQSSEQVAAGFAEYKAKRRICQACPLGPDCDWARFPYSKYNSTRTLLHGPTGQRDPAYVRSRVATHPQEFHVP